MSRRILDVNAYTTLDYAEGRVDHGEGSETAVAVVNATTPRDDPAHVELQVEMDATDLDAVAPHADRVTLSPDQARDLAADLEAAADDAEGERE